MPPNNWDTKVVGDLFHVQLGKMLNKAAKEKEPQFKYLGNSNVKWGYFDLAELKTMHFNDKEQEKFALKNGDIVLCEGGEVGRCAIWRGQDTNVYYQKALHRLRSKGEMVPEFFQSYMENIAGTKLLEDFTTKTSIAHLTREKLIKLPVKTPPLPEQEKIAQILSAWNNAITATRQLLAKSQQQQKALMQQLLTGKKRFPGFSGEWKEVKLSDICQINPRKPDKPGDGRVSFIPMDAVSEDARIVRFDERNYEEVANGFTSFQNNDVLIAKITPCFENGKGCYVDNLVNGVGFGSTEFHVLRAKENAYSRFIYYVTNMTGFRIRGEMNMQGSAGQKRVSADFLKTYKMVVPPTVEEQQKIASLLSAADSKTEALRQKLGYLKQEKRVLMQQLFTGKRRLKIDNREVVEWEENPNRMFKKWE